MRIKELFKRNETLVALVLVAFSIATGLSDPSFFSVANLFDLLRAATVPGIFAIGVLVVLLAGGIDVSFTAVAAFSMYSATLWLANSGLELHWSLVMLLAMLLGLLLGLVNAVFIGIFRLPTLIVTLGTLSLFRGSLLTFVGTDLISNLPPSMRQFSRAALFRFVDAEGIRYTLPLAFLFLVAVVLITWFILYRTMLGRAMFAYGGNPEAASRAGFNTTRLQFFVYSYVGLLAGLAGMIHASLARVANPFDLVGLELNVIAAVVLGGASITGGRGTITGTLLGVLLITLISNSLITLGIPSTWQRVVVGLLILLGTGVPAYRELRGRRNALT
jgi:simple sugar transport system permease protein